MLIHIFSLNIVLIPKLLSSTILYMLLEKNAKKGSKYKSFLIINADYFMINIQIIIEIKFLSFMMIKLLFKSNYKKLF